MRIGFEFVCQRKEEEAKTKQKQSPNRMKSRTHAATLIPARAREDDELLPGLGESIIGPFGERGVGERGEAMMMLFFFRVGRKKMSSTLSKSKSTIFFFLDLARRRPVAASVEVFSISTFFPSE